MGTHRWDRRVNLSVLGISSVDNHNISAQIMSYEETPHVFLCDLSEYIIDNNMD